MAKPWNAKDERQYKHVLESELERGVKTDEAKEIAGRTVNKQRRGEGRTPNKRTMGTGNPNTPLQERSRDEVYNVAKEMAIQGRGSMSKAELVTAIQRQRS